MADAKDSLPAISDETKVMLEDHVKKGKARKFILICKGATIKTLIVFKKGPFGPKVNQAKKDGFRGEAITGIITGKGVNIELQLPGSPEVSSEMKTDGNVYSSEPCKIAKLRKFLVEEAELKFKPEFKLVTDAAAIASVNESDEESGSDTTSGETVPPEGTSAEPESTPEASEAPPAADQKQKLVAALKNLTPLIQEAVAAHPARKGEILGPVKVIKDHIAADQLPEAKEELLNYAPFVKELAQPQAAAAPSPTDAKAPSDQKQKLVEALKKLQPHIVKAISGNPAREGEIKASIGQIREEIKAAQFDQATQNIKSFTKLIIGLNSQPATDAKEPADPAAKTPSFVKMQQSRLAWVEARKTVRNELAALESKILEVSHDEEDFKEIASDAKDLYGILDSMDERLIDKLDEALNQESEEGRHAKHLEATRILKEYEAFLANDPLVNDIDDNPFQKVKIYSTLSSTLAKLEKNLT